MTSPSDAPAPVRRVSARLLGHPIIRIVLALLSIAIPFAVVATAFNLFVSDKILKKVGVLAALGVYRVTGFHGWTSMLATVPAFIMGAVLEEVVMRGVVFRILEQWLGSWLALAISAALFGLLHLLNPGVTLLNAGAIMLEAGILLAAAYMLTRRLWLCIGTHFAWNFTQGGIFSAAVSGGATNGLFEAKLVGPVWLTGGTFGAEASVVAVVVCLAAGLLLLRAARRKGHVIPATGAAAPYRCRTAISSI